MYQMISLPYSLYDLEPYISYETMKYHYEILYKNYVDNYNKILINLMNARRNSNYENIKCLEKNLSFNGAGAILHSMFFENLSSRTSSMSNLLSIKIANDFGSYEAFLKQFLDSISNIEGSGWGILGYSKSIDKLLVLQCEKHQNLTIWDFFPILVVDIWEHAYYLDYKTEKKKYIENIFKVINWDVVSKRFDNIIK